MKHIKKLLMISLLTFMVGVAQAQLIDQDSKSRNQIIPMDLIVQGSECVGVDCPNNPSFGFNTIELKENNLRIRFTDTSTSGSFPTSDWEITINDSGNGGASYFGIQDVDAGRFPFRIFAGAPSNSLIVDAQGDIGIGTSNPVVEVHVTDGDSPTLRLEQNGSSGFTAQTWDLAGNETNFFVRDVTNGSKLPFRIKPSAPSNSIYIDTDGDVGMGTASPDASLHVMRTNSSVDELFHVVGAGTVLNRLESSDGGAIQLRIKSTSTNRRIIAEDNSSVQQSQIEMNDAGVFNFYAGTVSTFTTLTAGSSGLTASSSRSLKNNIKELEIPNILERIDKVPVTSYNWKESLVGPEISKRKVIGLIAQDFYPVLEHGKDTEINGQDVQMALWMGVQELHKKDKEIEGIIEEKDARIAALEDQVAELNNKLDEIAELLKFNQQDLILNAGKGPALGQNYPNPYRHETSIEYYLPDDIQNAEIHFFDVAGKLVKKFAISSKGKGKLNIQSDGLPQGSYHYSLILDGKIVDSKQMVLSK